MFTPIDLQCNITPEPGFRPVIAHFNAFTSRTDSDRELLFAEMYPAEYLTAITSLRYSTQTLRPNFENHCKPETLEMAWEYFEGGAGLHSTKISRTQAIKEFGLKIKSMPACVEALLFEIMESYTEDTKMLVDSLDNLEEVNAYFETRNLSYEHYAKYQPVQTEINKTIEEDVENDVDSSKKQTKKVVASDKYCVESGWRT